MCNLCINDDHGIPRREFIKTVGISSAGIYLGTNGIMSAPGIVSPTTDYNKKARIRCAFLYPPSNILEAEGYYSWPGADFDAEGRQKKYMSRIKEIESKLGIQIETDPKPLDAVEDVDKLIAELKTINPDGLLLIPFKKSHYDHVVRIVEETQIPTVILATLGILLIEHINQLKDRPGVYLINSPDDLDAVENGLNMIKSWGWIKNALIVNIGGTKREEIILPVIGTRVRNITHQKFYDYFSQTKVNKDVLELAKQYRSDAVKIVQPTEEDIIEASKCYFIFKKIIADEGADALMMDCLPGLRKPHKHVPPCMGFMSLRDEGIAIGCQSDINSTITMMLLQQLFGKPGFQHNASYNTEKDCYFCAHCTSPSKMNGIDKPADPYELMSHCESGWGTVPRVLFKKDQEVTIARYLSDIKKPQMLIYSGRIISCPEIPPTGGCRTNVETTINELEDGSKLKGQHLIMIYGNYARQLRRFSQLYNIEAIV